MSDKPLDGRVAIITGGGRGIGNAICRTLISAGAAIVVADTGGTTDGQAEDPDLADTIAESLGERAIGYGKSVASPEAAQEMVALARETFGGIDILVNCAAILRDALVFKGQPEDWDEVISTNLSAAYYLINAATPHMREQFKDHPLYDQTLEFIEKYDAPAFDPDAETYPLSFFEPMIC